jgi:hypothetical protein
MTVDVPDRLGTLRALHLRPNRGPTNEVASRLSPLASRLSPLASRLSPLASRLSPLASYGNCVIVRAA